MTALTVRITVSVEGTPYHHSAGIVFQGQGKTARAHRFLLLFRNLVIALVDMAGAMEDAQGTVKLLVDADKVKDGS